MILQIDELPIYNILKWSFAYWLNYILFYTGERGLQACQRAEWDPADVCVPSGERAEGVQPAQLLPCLHHGQAAAEHGRAEGHDWVLHWPHQQDGGDDPNTGMCDCLVGLVVWLVCWFVCSLVGLVWLWELRWCGNWVGQMVRRTWQSSSPTSWARWRRWHDFEIYLFDRFVSNHGLLG